MHIISVKRLKLFWDRHPDFETAGRLWITRMKLCRASNLIELRDTFQTADPVGNFTVFNIRGNTYRLITRVDYKTQKVFIRHVLTHAEYDKEKWKQDDWFLS